jgi:predicted thioesterase
MDLRPGATHELTWTVTPERTADAMGNPGVRVFATPWVIALLEQACGAMIAPELPAGASTVGTMIEMRHLAATPVGMAVRARATLLETDGRRFLFSVEAWDAKDKIAEGRHERMVVADLAKFLERAMKKGA